MTTRFVAFVVVFGLGCQAPSASPTASDAHDAADPAGTADTATATDTAGTADPASAPARGRHHGHANHDTPELEGGDPLETSVIPAGSGWWCYSTSEMPTGLSCFRAEAACKAEQGPRAIDPRYKDATVNGVPDLPTECARTTPVCFTGGATGQEHGLYCFAKKSKCLNDMGAAKEQGWSGSGCAAVP